MAVIVTGMLLAAASADCASLGGLTSGGGDDSGTEGGDRQPDTGTRAEAGGHERDTGASADVGIDSMSDGGAHADAHPLVDAAAEASLSDASVAFVQASQENGTDYMTAQVTVTVSLSNAVALGDLLVVLVGVGSTAPGAISVTDNASTGPWKATSPLACVKYAQLFYATASTSVADTITVVVNPGTTPVTGSVAVVVAAAEYSGPSAHPTLDSTLASACITSPNDGGTYQSMPLTIAKPDLLVGGFVDPGNVAPLASGPGWHTAVAGASMMLLDSTSSPAALPGTYRITEMGDSDIDVTAMLAAFRFE
jgi:hypothetical protein